MMPRRHERKARRRASRVRLACGGLAAALVLGACNGTDEIADAPEITLRVGMLFTTAGRGGDLAAAVLGAAALAEESAAARYRVTLEITDADYAGDPDLLPGALEELAGADALVIATNDPEVLPAVRELDDRPVLYTLIGSDAAIPEGGTAFRVAPSHRLEAETLAGYLTEERGYRRISVVTDTTVFGEEGARHLTAALGAAGVQPVTERSFDPGEDVHTLIMEAGQRGAQAMIVWVDSPSEAARIVVDVHRMAQPYQLALSANLATETFARNATAQVTPVAFRDGLLSAGTWAGPWFRLARIIDFYSEFRARHAALAPVEAAAVFDAFLALAAAARTHGNRPAGLIAGLEALEDFEGAGVPITFGPGGREGIDARDMAILAFTKRQESAGGEFFPDVDTGGGFFTVVYDSLDLPDRYRFLTRPA